MKIQGARVVVTGGGRGLGREFAMQFLDAGARVMVCDVVAFTIALFIVENEYVTGRVFEIDGGLRL